MIAISLRTAATADGVESLRFRIILHANNWPLSLRVASRVVPNWPLPSTRPKAKSSVTMVRGRDLFASSSSSRTRKTSAAEEAGRARGRVFFEEASPLPLPRLHPL